MLKLLLLIMAFANIAFANARSFSIAIDMYLSQAVDEKRLDLIRNNQIFYGNTKLSIIESDRSDKLLFLSAEKTDNSLFIFELRNGINNIILPLEKKIVGKKDSSVKIKVLNNKSIISSKMINLKEYLKINALLGKIQLVYNNIIINQYEDSLKTRELIYELMISLNKKIDSKQYSDVYKNSFVQSKLDSVKTKKSDKFKVINEEQPLKLYHESTSKTLMLVNKSDYIEAVIYPNSTVSKGLWKLVRVNNDKEGWMYIDEKKYTKTIFNKEEEK